jgi:excisionase family DNA binding protein
MTMPLEKNRLLTTEETAAYIGVEVQTLAVWRCKHRYGLKFVRVGRLIRYREADVIEFIDRHLESMV